MKKVSFDKQIFKEKSNRFQVIEKIIFVVCILASTLSFGQGTISLWTDETPEPNDVFTVFVLADEPLMCLRVKLDIYGNAEIVSQMNQSDAEWYGWKTTLTNSDPNAIPAFILGLDDDENDNYVVGYFQIQYHGEYMATYLNQTESLAFNMNGVFDFSDDVITFGQLSIPAYQPSAEPVAVPVQGPSAPSGERQFEAIETFLGFPEMMMMDGMSGEGEEPDIIVVDANIVSNQIWEPNNIYYVVDDIDVQSLLVIEPGTMVVYGEYSGLTINNGGCLIARGTPNELVYFTTDYMYLYYPEYIGRYWQNLPNYGPQYNHAIRIQETASTATTINYSFIEAANVAIVIDNISLDKPVENNYIFGNVYGIVESGVNLTNIRNNLIFANWFAGVEIFCSPASDITIEHNTCDYNEYCGITVHGVEDANNMPTVAILNNIVSYNQECGLNLVDNYILWFVMNTGYWGNGTNKNWEFTEYSPIYQSAYECPYELRSDNPYDMHYLVQDCNFINAGSLYIDQTHLVGMTTDANGLPDSDRLDIGFHYMNWDFEGGSSTGSGMDELMMIADNWLRYDPTDPNGPGYIDPNVVDPNLIPPYQGDFDQNGIVNLADLSLLSQEWSATAHVPDLVPIISTGVTKGWINVDVDDLPGEIYCVYAYVDGQNKGKINRGKLGIDMTELGTSSHEIKLVALDFDGRVTCSAPVDLSVSTPFDYCIMPQTYEPNCPFMFYIQNPTAETITVEMYNLSGETVWSQTCTGQSIAETIPASVTTDSSFMPMSCQTSTSMVAKTAVAKTPKKISSDVKAMMLLPDYTANTFNYRVISTVENALRDKGIKMVILGGRLATAANVAKYASQLEYLYVNSHGMFALDSGICRTHVVLADGDCGSMKVSDFPAGQAPTWLEALSPIEERNFNTFYSMGFQHMKFAFNDACYGGRLKISSRGYLITGGSGQQGLFDVTHNDMSLAFCPNRPNDTFIYQGWYDESISKINLPIPLILFDTIWINETSFQKFTRVEWESLGNGKNLYDALFDTINEQTEFGSDDAVNNYRIKGQGILTDMRLTP